MISRAVRKGHIFKPPSEEEVQVALKNQAFLSEQIQNAAKIGRDYYELFVIEKSIEPYFTTYPDYKTLFSKYLPKDWDSIKNQIKKLIEAIEKAETFKLSKDIFSLYLTYQEIENLLKSIGLSLPSSKLKNRVESLTKVEEWEKYTKCVSILKELEKNHPTKILSDYTFFRYESILSEAKGFSDLAVKARSYPAPSNWDTKKRDLSEITRLITEAKDCKKLTALWEQKQIILEKAKNYPELKPIIHGLGRHLPGWSEYEKKASDFSSRFEDLKEYPASDYLNFKSAVDQLYRDLEGFVDTGLVKQAESLHNLCITKDSLSGFESKSELFYQRFKFEQNKEVANYPALSIDSNDENWGIWKKTAINLQTAIDEASKYKVPSSLVDKIGSIQEEFTNFLSDNHLFQSEIDKLGSGIAGFRIVKGRKGSARIGVKIRPGDT